MHIEEQRIHVCRRHRSMSTNLFHHIGKHSNLHSPAFGVSHPHWSAYSLSHQYVAVSATLQSVIHVDTVYRKFYVVTKPILARYCKQTRTALPVYVCFISGKEDNERTVDTRHGRNVSRSKLLAYARQFSTSKVMKRSSLTRTRKRVPIWIVCGL